MNHDKKRGAENPMLATFSLWHLNLAYWMGRTLGDRSKDLKDWQDAILKVCGAPCALGNLTPEQARQVMVASGIFSGQPAGPETDYMTQRMQ